MKRIPLLALLPPVIFAAMAGLFLGGMFRSDPDALPSTLVGQPAPEVNVTPIPGYIPFTRAALEEPGPKIVNFWASWCAPCRVEHPYLMQLQDEGLPIYGVNQRDDPDDARAFLDELGNPYEGIGGDANGRVSLDWGVYGLPETFVIDGDGAVLLRFAGPVTEVILENRIRPALAQASN
ncbi:MAG: DsbE family thiol:disulfide interchange protein [Boseongicola sp.]|nr:DsbE family thiol:disulfide interchange protein [Boseongicola sp.]